MKLELNKDQLELLKFIVLNFESNDDEEEQILQAIEGKIYDLQEKEALKLVGILNAQEKQPTMEWKMYRLTIHENNTGTIDF